jgi:signal transduction histidine kinase
VIQISDQGVGIAEAEQGHVFEPFFRGGSSRSSVGAGLGLAIVKQCVEAHGGSIHVESQAGNGATFVVELPMYGKNEAEAPD